MKLLTLACVAMTCVGATSALADPESRDARLPLVFWNANDVEYVDGRVRFGAEPLRLAGHAAGFPEMQYACDAPAEEGGRWIYGWRNTDWSDRTKRATEVIRCRTVDGKTFTETQTVFRNVNKDWQGFSNIVRRPTDGALFLFSWAPASLHVFRSDNGTDWRLLTEKAYGDHDAMCVVWHRQLGEFVNYQHTLQPFAKRYPDNIGNLRRVLSFRRSTDGVRWTSFSPPFLQGNTLWLPDAEDPLDLELYRCAVFPCQGRYAMLLLDYMPHPQEANPRRATTKHSSRYMTEWAISHDGLNWQRPFRTTDAVEQTIWTPLQGPFVHDGFFLFYSSSGQIAAAPEDQIFYVTCRSNGYFSTRPFLMPARGLALNAHARYRPGEDPGQAVIMAELRDENNAVLPGYELAKCLIENRAGQAIPLLWDGKNGAEHAGRKVRLRFFLRDAKIYTVTAHDEPKRSAAVEAVTNSVGMQLARIEPGSFPMGEEEGDFDERPVHSVRITRPFWMGVTEVTNRQYERFDPKHKAVRGKLGYATEEDEAVVFVSWHEAVAFCEWLSRTEGKPYRLPTEAEWEFACRAGTTSRFSTGDALPKPFHKNARRSWFPASDRGEEPTVRLTVGQTPPNAWGLRDMHGNVEEWCLDWYGPYPDADQTDPTGRASGDFRVTRGGSHSTTVRYLRSANRLGALPEDRNWLIGFRVVQAAQPETEPLDPPPPPANRRDVRQAIPADLDQGPDPQQPYFQGPRQVVKIPPESHGPLFSKHNHCPALVDCPNGDLLAIWYTCREEPGRELGIVASRLRYGADQWDDASPFWDAPDRNDHASALWSDGEGKIYHFNGLAAAATWGSLATVLRVSDDSGASWSRARLIMPEHGLHHMPIESVFRSREGHIIVPCDAATGGKGGSTILISRDGGDVWSDPSEGRPTPTFSDGETGALIAGIHAGVVQLADGRLLALGRDNDIGGRMPMSISDDFGKNWTYRASPFPPIGGGQRLALLRLREGPIFLASFAKEITIRDASGKERPVSGLFAALSNDEGTTWSVKRIISDDQAPHTVDGGGNTGKFTMSAHSAEPRGYLSVCQTPDGVIQLISSKQHYAFNLAWLNRAPPPAP